MSGMATKAICPGTPTFGSQELLLNIIELSRSIAKEVLGRQMAVRLYWMWRKGWEVGHGDKGGGIALSS
jgi:hypothetical protein